MFQSHSLIHSTPIIDAFKQIKIGSLSVVERGERHRRRVRASLLSTIDLLPVYDWRN